MSHPLISQLLKKFKVEKVQDLSVDDQIVVSQYELILNVEDVTVEHIKKFCATQIKRIEKVLATGDNTDKKDNFLKASLFVYLNMLELIEAPKIEKERIEKELSAKLKQ